MYDTRIELYVGVVNITAPEYHHSLPPLAVVAAHYQAEDKGNNMKIHMHRIL